MHIYMPLIILIKLTSSHSTHLTHLISLNSSHLCSYIYFFIFIYPSPLCFFIKLLTCGVIRSYNLLGWGKTKKNPGTVSEDCDHHQADHGLTGNLNPAGCGGLLFFSSWDAALGRHFVCHTPSAGRWGKGMVHICPHWFGVWDVGGFSSETRVGFILKTSPRNFATKWWDPAVTQAQSMKRKICLSWTSTTSSCPSPFGLSYFYASTRMSSLQPLQPPVHCLGAGSSFCSSISLELAPRMQG